MADQHGGPTWAGDITATLMKLANRWGDGEPVPWGTYHYSGQPATTWQGFAEAIFEQAEELEMIDINNPLLRDQPEECLPQYPGTTP